MEKGTSLTISRLMEERKAWRKDHPFGFWARPINKDDNTTDMMHWEVGIPGKLGVSHSILKFRLFGKVENINF